MAVTTIASAVPQRQYAFSTTPGGVGANANVRGTALDPQGPQNARADLDRLAQERNQAQNLYEMGRMSYADYMAVSARHDDAQRRYTDLVNNQGRVSQAAAALSNPDYGQTRVAIMDQLNTLGGRLGYGATPISNAQQSASNQQAINAQQSVAASARGVNPAMAQRLAAYGTGNALANNAATAAQNAPKEALAREQMNQEQYQRYLQALTALNQNQSDAATRALGVQYADEAAKRQRDAQRNQDIKDYVGMGVGALGAIFGGGR